ncbi:MAG: hypothetical protein E7366_01235 [Clostridiales bacterium]|nr:hypothetical protein [Clostridiales bacterium]
MRICFVNRENVKQFRERYDVKAADLFVFGFNDTQTVSYERELHRETTFFEEMVKFSKESNACTVCGCWTDMKGLKRKSAVVANEGKLLGVSDAIHSLDGAINGGGELRVYETKAGKIGVIIAEDLYFPEIARDLALFGCDCIVCPFDKKMSSIHSALLRAEAFFYGTPLLFCAKEYCMLADGKGEVVFATPQSPAYADLELTKEYHFVETRRRLFLPKS